MGVTSKRASLFSCTALIALSLSAAAWAAPRNFDIPAQDAVKAIPEFGRQAGVQVVAPADRLKGVRTMALRGMMEVRSALNILLRGTGLEVASDDGRVIVLRAQAEETKAAQGQTPQVDADTSAAGEKSVEKVTVTGTRIRGVGPVGQSPKVLDRADIDRTGYATVQQVVQTLPQNFGGGPGEATQVAGGFGSSTTISFGSTVNLRGLGADATLPLLNGRRLAPAGFAEYVDVSTIPLSAISRIEILPDGASAAYGADAVGGVINFILKDTFDGFQTGARYGFVTEGDAEEYQFSQSGGFSWATGSLIVNYEYYERTPLAAKDRAYAANSDLRRLGGSNFSNNQSNPGNIIQIGATPVQLAIPTSQDGTSLTQADLLVGQVNFQNLQEGALLLPGQARHSGFAAFRQDITPDLELFAEALYSLRDFSTELKRTGVTLTVPQTNAYRQLNNLFPGQGNLRIAYNFTDDVGPILQDGEATSLLAASGLRLDFFETWSGELSLSYGTFHEESFSRNLIDTAVRNAALASSTLATAFNPFADGSNTNQAVLDQMIKRFTFSSFDTEFWQASARFDGSLFETGAGDARLAFGGEFKDISFEIDSFDQAASGVRTDGTTLIREGNEPSHAAYAEVYLPLVSARNRLIGVERLELSASVRYESYEHFGETTNPRFGALWSPVDGLALKASYGTSFKTPHFGQTNVSRIGQVLSIPASVDPLATGGFTETLVLLGGTTKLEPETADTWTATVSLQPSWLSGFRADITYFDVAFENRIATPPGVNFIFLQPSIYGSLLTRNPTQAQVDAAVASVDLFAGAPPPAGTIEAIVDSAFRNIAIVNVDGFDLSAVQTIELERGKLDFNLSATYLTTYEEATTPTAPSTSVLDTVFRPVDLRLRGGINWSWEGYAVAAAINHTDDYFDNLSTPARSVESWTTIDLQFAYEFADSPDSTTKTRISLSAINVFDEEPPFVNNPIGIGFDAANASPLGRFVALSVTRKW